MSQIKLTTPEGYFEKSMQTTMAAVGKVRRKRMAMLSGAVVGSVAAALALFVMPDRDMTDSVNAEAPAEHEYYAMEAEMARLDIFLEINQ